MKAIPYLLFAAFSVALSTSLMRPKMAATALDPCATALRTVDAAGIESPCTSVANKVRSAW